MSGWRACNGRENKPSDSEGFREKLAEERTLLAKSRTMQSFVRTGIALLAIGITVLKLFKSTLSISLLEVALVFIGLFLILYFTWKTPQLTLVEEKVEKDTQREETNY